MPFPLIAPAAALAVATAAVIAYAKRKSAEQKLSKLLADSQVAILGTPQVGKTALLERLQTSDAVNTLAATAEPRGGSFELELAGKKITFTVPRDVSGEPGLGFHEWKDAFTTSGVVWYLFRADRIANGDPDETALVKSHLNMLADWMPSTNRPLVTLIGTWADAHPDWCTHPKRVERAVANSDTIKAGCVKLHHASLVVGSLSTVEDVKKLKKDLQSATKLKKNL